MLRNSYSYHRQSELDICSVEICSYVDCRNEIVMFLVKNSQTNPFISYLASHAGIVLIYFINFLATNWDTYICRTSSSCGIGMLEIK